MEGFVNNSISPFEYGLKYSNRFSNYGVTNISRADNQSKQNDKTIQTHTEDSSDKFYSAEGANNLLGASIDENIENAVETLTTDTENKHDRLRKAAIIGGSVIVVGALSIGLTKGKLTKTVTNSLGKIADNATKKIEELKQKPSMTKLEGRYLGLLQGINRIAFMARGALFNISPLKDVLFEKFARKVCKLDKPCDAITNTFRKMSFATVKSSYKTANKKLYSMTKTFEDVNEKILSGKLNRTHPVPTPSTKKIMRDNVVKIKSAFSDSFSVPHLEERNNAIIQKFNGLGEKTYDCIYGRLKDFVTDIGEWTSFVPERLVAKDKSRIMANLADKKRILTNNPQDNYNAINEILSKLSNAINPNSIESREILKSLKSMMNSYISLSGEYEADYRGKLIKMMNAQLHDAYRLPEMSKYTPAQSKYITSLLNQFGRILNTDKKGLIEEQLSLYKHLLPEKEYKKVKAVAEKAIKSLNKAVYNEGFEYTDKCRDLAVGSALTDVAIGTALPIATTSIAMASADTKQKKRSVGLRYGLPLLAGIATTTISTVKLISGGKSLALGALVSVAGNEIFERLDKYLIKRDEERTQQKEQQA